MSANQARFRVATMARVLGVSPSGYYAWRRRPPSARARADAELRARVQAIHGRSRGTYGAPRIHAELTEGGVAVSRKRVARVMRSVGVAGGDIRRRRRGEPAPRPSHDTPECPGPPGPGSGRAALRGGRAEPALGRRHHLRPDPGRLPVPGHRPRRVQPARRRLGHGGASSHPRTLVVEALEMAVTQRRPEAVIHHSDRLPVSTSLAFGARWPGTGRRAIDGFGRRLLRQCDGRELLRDPGVRAARPNDKSQRQHAHAHEPTESTAALAAGNGACQRTPKHGRRCRVHRGVVQHTAASLRARLPVATGVRTAPSGRRCGRCPACGRPTGAHKSVGSRAAHGIHTAHRNQC